MRGTLGAIACFSGLTALPLVIVLLAGFAYFHLPGTSGGAWLGTALAGMGAAAIGLNLGTGVRLARGSIRGVVPVLIAAATALSIGVFGFPLLRVLLVILPLSLLAAWLTRPR